MLFWNVSISYKAKKNQQYYYKCGTIGCACNKRSEKLHEQFKSKLDDYIVNIDEEKLPILKNAMLEIFEKNNASTIDSKTTFQSQLKEINKKLERLEERFVNEEMSQDIFEKSHKKLKLEKHEIEAHLTKPEMNASNPEKAIELALHLATKLNTLWDSIDYLQKQKLQNLVFPDGMNYNRKTDQCRTLRVNEAFLSIAELARVLDKIKTDNLDDVSGLSVSVGVDGFEPPTLCL